MKLQIDTTNKTISVEESIKFSELLKNLKLLFPKGEWKDYELKTQTIINWNAPYIITQPYIAPPNPYPWWSPVVYGSTTGVYNANNDNITSKNNSSEKMGGNNNYYNQMTTTTPKETDLITLTNNGIYCVEVVN